MDSIDQNFSKFGSSGVTIDDICNKIEVADSDREHGNGPESR